MSKVFRAWDVDEVWLFPASVQDFVPPGHIAHLIRETVREGLDLRAILSQYDEERGYPPYHPGMMTALLLYAYSQGIYSSRRIDRACHERVDFMAVTGLSYQDFRHDQRVWQAASGGAIGSVCAGPWAVPQSGSGQARPCRARRHQDQGERLQAQGDELRPDGGGRGEARRRGRGMD